MIEFEVAEVEAEGIKIFDLKQFDILSFMKYHVWVCADFRGFKITQFRQVVEFESTKFEVSE